MAKVINMPNPKMVKTIVGSRPPVNAPGSDTRRRADKGLETFERDNSKAVVEAMNDLLTRKPEE